MTERIAFAGKISVEGRRIRGSVNFAGARVWRNGEWVEIDPAALVKADVSNVVARWNHDPEKVLARVTNDTLNIRRTDQGIEYESADLPNTSAANDALEYLRGGYANGSSFEIGGLRSTFSTDPDGTRVRRYTHIDELLDVSPVFDPAFTESAASAFKKETPVSTPTPEAEEPTAPEATKAPAPEARATDGNPRPQFTVQGDLFEASLAFAKKLDTAQVDSALAGFWAEAGDEPDEGQMHRIEAFTQELETRRNAESKAKERRNHLKLMRDIQIGRIPKAPEAGIFESDDYKAAFNRYLRGETTVMEQFAQSIAGNGGADGGYAVPDGFLNRITERLEQIGGIAPHAETITTADGQSLRWPSNDDTANSAAIAAEGVAGAAGADLTFGSITLGAFSYSSNGTGNVPLKVSWELLQDSAVDIEAFVGRKLGERIGRKQAADLATGGGTTLPFGLLDKTPDTVTATTTYAAAVEMTFHIDPAYRNDGNCRWVMSDTTAAKYMNAVDLNGRPLWLATSVSGMEGRPMNTLLGYPVALDNGAGDLVAFGDIRLGYIIRRVRGIQVLVNPYSSSGTRQTEYHAWARMDANIQDAYAYSVGDFTSVIADAVAG